MKRILLFLLALMAICLLTHADETRYYLIRGGQLPDDVTCIDLRPEHSTTDWSTRNIYRSTTARYALFEKRADSWWQISVDAQRPVDLSAVSDNWTLCMRLRRTVDYNLTLCLLGQSTDQGYTITTTAVPADGQWRTIRVPLSSFKGAVTTGNAITGSLVRLHSDLGYIGNEVGIDFCYLTDNATTVDAGQVQDECRYYLVSNSRTPKSVNYDMTDFSARLSARYSGWMQWSYVPFPYYSMEQSGSAVTQLCTMSSLTMPQLNEDWALIAQIRTDMLGAFTLTFYHQGMAYSHTVTTGELVRDGKTWNRLYIPLDEAERATYTGQTFVACSLHAPSLTAGQFSIGSLMLTNNHSANDPDPIVPGDPANGQQIWLINDGTPLPISTTVTDYRLLYTNYWAPRFNNATRKESDSYITIQATNGWYSLDAYPTTPVDLTAVAADWKLYLRIRTNSTYRPINLILYSSGNHELHRHQLSATDIPAGQWVDLEIPMTTFLGSQQNLLLYQANERVFTIHSDNGGAAGVEINIEHLYFGKAGESTPAPVPGDTPLDEPELTPLPDGIDNINGETIHGEPQKLIHDGRLYIRLGNRTIDVLGRTIR